jgi:hypothetical protein
MSQTIERATASRATRPWPVRTGALGLTLMAAFVASAGAYPLLRLVQFLLWADPDPRGIIYAEHAGFYWRCLIAGFLGVMVGMLVGPAAVRDHARVALWLKRAGTAFAIVVLVQGLLIP